MNSHEQQDRVLAFLKTQQLAVIATNSISLGSPEAALVAYAEDQDLFIYFQTSADTRKAVNIAQSPSVSFVFGLIDEVPITVQYEGVASLLENQADVDRCKRLFEHKESPTDQKFLNRPGIKFYKVVPIWIGYSDYTKQVPEVFELSVFS